MNSFFGVLASPNCRYFSLNMANAITHFGQEIIQLTAKKIEEDGIKVIYSDTDSVFLKTDNKKENAKELGKEIQNKINSFYDKYIKEKYDRKSYLELEFKKYYLAFMLPKVRNAKIETGSKKRYAGLIEKNGKEELEITGLEAIRGDWTEAAKDFQLELLNKVFHKEDPILFIKDYIKKIKQGKLDAKLIYRKSIRKNLNEYTKTTPPHVKAARKLEKVESNLIEYYITEDGPEPIQNHKHKLDYDHYIEKQITPIADTILHFFNTSVSDIMKNTKQKTLF
jgi:DNA polymerase-2